jgi:hypothetical protein
MTKAVYGYNDKTGEYMGETTAYESPLEPGVYLIPANATETAPPETGEHEAAVWHGAAWEISEDWREREGYVNGEPIEIEALGPLPEGWSDTPPEPTLADLQTAKIAEIRAAALDVGRAGATLLVAPGVSYHLALTPEDVAYLQSANTVAKIEWQMLGLEPEDPLRTAEIKEKWYEDGVEHTRLHTGVPEAIHDATLALAALQAAEILRRQETLIQTVLDCETTDEVRAITWHTSTEVA